MQAVVLEKEWGACHINLSTLNRGIKFRAHLIQSNIIFLTSLNASAISQGAVRKKHPQLLRQTACFWYLLHASALSRACGYPAASGDRPAPGRPALYLADGPSCASASHRRSSDCSRRRRRRGWLSSASCRREIRMS